MTIDGEIMAIQPRREPLARAMSCVAMLTVAGCGAATGLHVSVSASVPLTSVTMTAALHRSVQPETTTISVNGATVASFAIILPDANENVALTVTAVTRTGQTLTQTTSKFVAAHTWPTLSVQLGAGPAKDGGAALDLAEPAANDGGAAADLGEPDKGDLATPPIMLVKEVTASENSGAANSRQAMITLGAGHLVVVAIFWSDNSASVTVNDTAGNVWQQIEGAPIDAACADKNGPRAQLRYVTNSKPGTTTITVTQSTTTSNPMGFFVLEYANVKHMTAVDGERGASATMASNTMSPGSMTTTQDGDLIVALFSDPKSSGALRPDPSYHLRAEATAPYALVEDNLPSAFTPGPYAPQAYLPMGTSDACWGATAAAFRPR
jgi:hypothetical protein